MTGLARGFAVAVLTGLLVAAVRAVPFDHTEHATLFVRCETCHAGAAATDRPLWPAPAECSACHDGKIEKAVLLDTAHGSPALEPPVHSRRPPERVRQGTAA